MESHPSSIPSIPREQGKNLLVRLKGEEHFFKTLEKTKQPYSRDALKRRLKATTYRYLRHTGKKGETSLMLVRMRTMIRKFYWIM
jgi:hypothetical protein